MLSLNRDTPSPMVIEDVVVLVPGIAVEDTDRAAEAKSADAIKIMNLIAEDMSVAIVHVIAIDIGPVGMTINPPEPKGVRNPLNLAQKKGMQGRCLFGNSQLVSGSEI
uniref:SJCHGC09470 protein n=1 Tax=Schistosoma japonicum TaxID=6182 RepID=Q5DAG6_SCHJA|nr:SJCHGC09470 protein [Schistosoma japonicum]